MWKYLVAFPIFMHGLAHISGFIASWTKQDAGYTDKPWIFPGGFTLHSAIGKAWGLIWMLAFVGLVGCAVSIVLQQSWWPIVAIVSAIISLVAIVPWWRMVPAGAKAGAFLDLLIIAALLSPWRDSLIQFLK